MAQKIKPTQQDNSGVTAFTNPGTAGGSGFWINLGGLKILTITQLSTNTGAWLTVNWTAVGFTAIPTIVATNTSQSTSGEGGYIELTSLSSPAGNQPELNGCSILARKQTGSNGNPKVNMLVIGV